MMELRMTAARRKAAHVDEELDAKAFQVRDEDVGGKRAMSDGV
jgi:hypothetical protein